MTECDVLVVGGGLAGVAAASSAAACGARTLLLEKGSELGGNVTQAYVHTLCGLYDFPRQGEIQYLNPGFTSWFAEGLKADGAALEAEIHGRVAVMPIFPPRLAAFTDKLIKRFPALSCSKKSSLEKLEINRRQAFPVSVVYSRQGEEYSVRSKIVIDTTGDAMAASLAGAEVDLPGGDALQNATLIFRVLGANEDDLAGYSRLRISAAIARAAQQGQLPWHCESIFVRPGEQSGEAYISLNLPKGDDVEFNPLDRGFMRDYKRHADELAVSLTAFLREQMQGWSECTLLELPVNIGVRESGRVVGRYVLTENDILHGVEQEDAVARSAWPIELWSDHYHASFTYPDKACDIPLRALISSSHGVLGMAGRCMSGTHEALGALRVLGTAMATGEAIGIAASIAVENDVELTRVSAAEVVSRQKSLHSIFNELS